MGLTCSVYSLRVPVGRSRLEEPAGVFVQIDLHGPRTLSTQIEMATSRTARQQKG